MFRLRKTTIVDRAVDRLRFRECYLNNGLRPELGRGQQELVERMKRDGYVMLERYVPTERLGCMQRELHQALHALRFQTPCLAQSKIDAVRDADLIGNYLYASPEQLSSRGLALERSECHTYEQVINDFNPSTLTLYMLADSENFRGTWLDPFLFGIIAGYLGVVPKMVEAYVRRNFPSPHRTMNHYWHRDLNHKHFLVKVFWFLSDCTLDTGPHEYIAGSHRNFDPLNGKHYYDDAELDSLYPRGSAQRIFTEVPAGTVILEDTRGLHRADMPRTAYRDLGYAVFMPWNDGPAYYELPRSAYERLSAFEQAFIPAPVLV